MNTIPSASLYTYQLHKVKHGFSITVKIIFYKKYKIKDKTYKKYKNELSSRGKQFLQRDEYRMTHGKDNPKNNLSRRLYISDK